MVSLKNETTIDCKVTYCVVCHFIMKLFLSKTPAEGDSKNSASAKATLSSGSYPKSSMYFIVPSMPIISESGSL